jgi:hypothetical protein
VAVPVHFVGAVGQWQATSNVPPPHEKILTILGV